MLHHHHQVKPGFHPVAVVIVVVALLDALVWVRGAALLFDPCLQHVSQAVVIDGGVTPNGAGGVAWSQWCVASACAVTVLAEVWLARPGWWLGEAML